MGIKSSLIVPTAAHQTAALKVGVNASGLVIALQEQIGEVSFLLKEVIKGMPSISLTAAGPISTSSPNIAMAQVIPQTVTAGMQVTDVTAGHLLGTVASGAGTTTLVLQANSAFAGSGSSDSIRIDDSNLATFQAQLVALS